MVEPKNSATNIKKTEEKKASGTDVSAILEKKISFFHDVIHKTLLNVQRNKMLDILGTSDVNSCIVSIKSLSEKLKNLSDNMNVFDTDTVIKTLQIINNELSAVIKIYGTDSFDDLLSICYGTQLNILFSTEEEKNKYDLLKKYFHPTNYRVITNPQSSKKDNYEKIPINLECQDTSPCITDFHSKVYGMKINIISTAQNKHIVIYGILDDIIVNFMSHKFISKKHADILKKVPNDVDFKSETFERFVQSLTLKDYFICETADVYSKYIGSFTSNKMSKQKTLPQLIKDFIVLDLYGKRNVLMQLLIHSKDYENKYIAYLLYDLLSNEVSGSVDSQEQVVLFDSFPWSIKDSFRDAMKKTVQYTQELSTFDMNKIPLEQQICLMKSTDTVKEKAMVKLKEVKSKSEDSGSKATQYLDGLLKVPFGIYRKEPILYTMNESRSVFKELVDELSHKNLLKSTLPELVETKQEYTSMEMIYYLNNVNKSDTSNNTTIKKTEKVDKSDLLKTIDEINQYNKEHGKEQIKIIKKNKKDLQMLISNYLSKCEDETKSKLLKKHDTSSSPLPKETKDKITIIQSKLASINTYMNSVKQTLDEAVYGHENAKKQIERIIGQWINGEQGGYCFGFEGPPGVGKTSLAKRGISDCLKDKEGISRPFAMIQMGGDSNGSTLHGHNYTYVGSTWGGIVQILMDKKCMNPIIFIDELDKISKTEHGKEIVGILTHLLDTTQNDCFQDKYFSGIDLDLSNALFVLSYNDVDQIDRILLDRIHRVRFSHLSLKEKLVICNKHVLAEVYKKMGLEGMVHFEQDVLKFIIEEYTCEAGVRKLKEVLFEIVGEINLDLLKTNIINHFPINITIEDIKTKYFKDKREVQVQKIHTQPEVGIINGLWANDAGLGGTLPIQAKFYPAGEFLHLKLTGMVGDVMNESANVALSIAWNLTPKARQEEIIRLYSSAGNTKTKFECNYGIHVHFPDGSTHKNGPSGGSCLTTVLYSLLNDKKIKNEIAMTGEISLDGRITAIGGLDLKILGGIKAGVKTFIFPEENKKDHEKYVEKYKDSPVNEGISFHSVEHISNVFERVFAC